MSLEVYIESFIHNNSCVLEDLRHRHTNIHYNHYIKISGISSSSNTTDYIILDTLMGFCPDKGIMLNISEGFSPISKTCS